MRTLRKRMPRQRMLKRMRGTLKEGLAVLGAAALLSGCMTHAETRAKISKPGITAPKKHEPKDSKAEHLPMPGSVSSDELSLQELQNVGAEGLLFFTAMDQGIGSTYNWFVYHIDESRTMDSPPDYALLNPRYLEKGQCRYVGFVMRNVRLEDGSRTDVVVRADRSRCKRRDTLGFAGLDLLLSMEKPEVLYRLEDGTLSPKIDDRLIRNLEDVTFRTGSHVYSILNFAPTSVAVVVTRQDK